MTFPVYTHCISRMNTWFAIVLLVSSHCFLIQGQMCLPEPGDKVINMCANSFNNGNSLYLDTSRAVNYQGSCTCQLKTLLTGGTVDLQLSARGNQTDCDTTLFLSPYIEYTFTCVGEDPIVATGKIESRQVVYITLTKSSSDAKAAMCVHIAQTSFGGSLSLLCSAGTLKPPTTTPVPVTTPTPKPTTTPTPPATPAPTTTTVAQPVSNTDSASICSADTRDTVINMCERDFGSGNSIYLDTTKSVNYQGECVCQLRAQGGTVDLELSVKGVHANCNAILYLAPPIDYTFYCVQSESVWATGKVEVGQTVFVTLSKASPDVVADLCVQIVQTSFGAGSLSVACNAGTPKPATTPHVPATTTVHVTNSTGSQVTTGAANTTTPAGPGQTNTNETTAKMVTVQKPQVLQPICQSSSGDKVNICERSYGSGTVIYLDTAKAVNYQGRCVCQLRAQGGAVDLQLTVQGASAECDATLYFSSIDHTYNCADTTPSNTTGRIESQQMVFLTLTKGTDAVADFCVLLIQTSSGAGSLSLTCSEGTLKPTTTPRVPATTTPLVPATTTVHVTNSTGSQVTTGATNTTTPAGPGQTNTNETTAKMVTVQKPQVLQPICQSSSGDKVNICERSYGSGTVIYLDTAKAVNYQGRCVCQLRAQGGAVDLQLTVQGASAECDATLYFSSIDHTYNCADTTPSNTTGRIESQQMVFLTLTKGTDAVADFCVLLVQTSSGGSLSLYCSEGTPKPTTTVAPPTTSPSSRNSTDSGVTETGKTVSIVVVAVFGAVVLLIIIMVTVKH